ncbi:sensor histidine kinase [Sporomusa acidovorans]|uniref:histidine kinase n=1 Tax=Sporomusa acidovorans (strain ATCC 49682 / DSM 3132 / Mol) TaxID=1123286 RepID=A0ABZ3IXP4_SPOA4|nr:ATP-binding protein [Sporomusa acidovorans]OZC22210.1 alkaline phosphatase synthesis sensor protein PhoR [Sporomusa acidovorans DSM 3132]SDE81524.1 HAMP domain-containing protein [Sporomusa acidovorans]
MRISLQHKLLGSFIIVVALVLAIVSTGVSLLIRDYFFASKERELTEKAYETARVVNGYYDEEINYGQLAGFINSIDSILGARVWIVDNSLNLLAASEERQAPVGTFHHRAGMMKKSPLDRRPDCDMPPEGQGMGWRHGTGRRHGMLPPPGMLPGKEPGPGQPKNLVSIDGMEGVTQQLTESAGTAWTKIVYHPYYEENMLLVAVPLIRDDGQSRGTVLINAPLAGFDSFLNRIYWYIAASGTVGILITIFIANYLSAGIIRPLKSMQAVASAMAGGDYSVQAKVKTNDEVGDLSRSLNLLAEALNDFVRKTEKTDKLRRDFVANVSHELRTPLTIMRGYNEAFLDGTISEPEQAEKYHKIMRDESVRLEKLIHELLDLSQLEARTASLETEPVSLAEIVDNLAALFGQRSEEKRVTLLTDVEKDLPDIQGNGDRLTQMVLILLDNAFKFTPAGGTVKVSLAAGNGWETLTIADTGVGISAEDLPYIWERFYKSDKAHTRTGGGTGLGLAIAREIINLHGAEPEVSSQAGQGTVFLIKFPLAKTALS